MHLWRELPPEIAVPCSAKPPLLNEHLAPTMGNRNGSAEPAHLSVLHLVAQTQSVCAKEFGLAKAVKTSHERTRYKHSASNDRREFFRDHRSPHHESRSRRKRKEKAEMTQSELNKYRKMLERKSQQLVQIVQWRPILLSEGR